MNTVFNTVFPEIKFTVTYTNRYPWLTNALRKSITVKNNLSTLSVLEPANGSLKIQYKSYKNKLPSLLRNAELAYYSNKLEINKSDHSKSWKVIRGITGMNTSNPKHFSFSINDCMVTDKQKIANEFNHFFVNIGPQMADNFISTRDPLSYVDTFMHSIVIYDMSEYDVKHIILSLKSNAAGWDNFPAYLGKQCIDVYITPLTFILNQSMTKGVFPDILKTARVIPLYKSGEKTILIIIGPYQLSHLSLKSLKKLCTTTSQSLWKKSFNMQKSIWFPTQTFYSTCSYISG